MRSRLPINFVSAIFCGFAYLAFAILSCSFYTLPFSPRQNWLSDLGSQVYNPQGATFYNAGVILSALSLAVWFTAGLSQWRLEQNRAQQRLLLTAQTAGVLAALSMVMSAIYPINRFQIHSFWSQVLFMMFSLGFGFSVAALRFHPLYPRASLYLGAVAAALPTLMLIFGRAYWLEWVAVGLIMLYINSIGIASLKFMRQPDRSGSHNLLADV